MANPPRKTIARSLGEFVGNILHGAKVDVTPKRTSQRLVLKHEVTEDSPQESAAGTVTLRRTTIEEVEIHRPTNAEDR